MDPPNTKSDVAKKPSRTLDLHVVAQAVNLSVEQVARVAELLDEGNTVPFITRYRKERTGNLDELQLRSIQQALDDQRLLVDRANAILKSIDGQEQLTAELLKSIVEADSLKRLEDLYLPFKPKRRSRGMMARERGLEPLANMIWADDRSIGSLESAAKKLVSVEQELPTTDDVLTGVSDIIAERISEDAEVRQKAREIANATGLLTVAATKAGKESGQEFRDYFDFSDRVSRIPPHRAMALNRGESSGALRVKFGWDGERAERMVLGHYRLRYHRFHDFLASSIRDGLSRLIQPSLDREVRRELTDKAEAHAVDVFAKNLRSLLMQPPLRNERVLAIDPGFRTGCKLAVLDENGSCEHTDLVHVIGSDDAIVGSRKKLAALLVEHRVGVVAIGNGTACRETEEMVAQVLQESGSNCRYVIVNESGASIYSASDAAREEFPNEDATVRGTISIGRRLQDPLSELVKIEPQHLGVGMYQHDVNAKRLQASLDDVITSCVNSVGVDLNSASASLLKYVSGLNQKLAGKVVAFRGTAGGFRSRKQLMDVPGIGKTTFTQAAGFLRISTGDDPLDATWIHPESYGATRRVLQRLQVASVGVLQDPVTRSDIQNRISELDRAELANAVGLGLPTLSDILHDLCRPGRDPRAELPGPVFKQGVLRLEDLHEGIELQGTVLNVVDFGAFVDIGLKDSGLVHISQMADRFVSSPHDFVSVGDVVKVWVQSIDAQRRRIGLTMRRPAESSPG